MAESDTTSSVDITAQDEFAGSAQSESTPDQSVAQDSEPATAVAVMDPPVDTLIPESAGVAEGSENNVTESVADGQDHIATPIESMSNPDPVPAAEDISTDISESAPVVVMTQSEGMAGGESIPVAEEPQESTSPTDIPAEEATEAEEKENNEQPQSIVIPTIPMRAAFLPVRSAQNHTGYALRGIF